MNADVQWLIRKNGNLILGPYSTDKIYTLIQNHELSPSDELCPENSYWFSLYETQEIQKFLKLEPEMLKNLAEYSEMDSDLEATLPEITKTEPLDIRETKDFSSRPALRPTGGIPSNGESLGPVMGKGREKLWNFLLFMTLIFVGIVIRWVLQAFNKN